MPNRPLKELPTPAQAMITSGSLINVLGVVYVHTKTANGGDLYRTRYGLACGNILDINNWYEKEWFEEKRERLIGTSAVYRVPTKPVKGKSMDLVVKYSRVGEDVPLNTHTLSEFVDAEFNSPWEEFSLVMEVREGVFGQSDDEIQMQHPLVIYVPPGQMQLWQTGRSRHKINSIIQKHSGISLDILRQYILVYGWIDGLSLVEAFEEMGFTGEELDAQLRPATEKVISDMERRGYSVADMKPHHVIISAARLKEIKAKVPPGEAGRNRQAFLIQESVRKRDYSVIDYELLLRTPTLEAKVREVRRHSYLDDQRNRFKEAPFPAFLRQNDILDVPYVHGHAESTDGLLWVVGRNPRLFDYFLPERWRKTPQRSLSDRNEVYYTLTKDNINIVWKTSRVGEEPSADESPSRQAIIHERGFNSPFESAAHARTLYENGIPTVYVRAIYMTGVKKIEPVVDMRRYDSHRSLLTMDGDPVLRPDRNYVTILGYYTGSDTWAATHEGMLYQPVDLRKAAEEHLIPREDGERLLQMTQDRMKHIQLDGQLLELNDLLVAIDPYGHMVKDREGRYEVRICNFDLIYSL